VPVFETTWPAANSLKFLTRSELNMRRRGFPADSAGAGRSARIGPAAARPLMTG
jgi:hypothetical protein